jgi:hypothetical protein
MGGLPELRHADLTWQVARYWKTRWHELFRFANMAAVRRHVTGADDNSTGEL